MTNRANAPGPLRAALLSGAILVAGLSLVDSARALVVGGARSLGGEWLVPAVVAGWALWFLAPVALGAVCGMAAAVRPRVLDRFGSSRGRNVPPGDVAAAAVAFFAIFPALLVFSFRAWLDPSIRIDTSAGILVTIGLAVGSLALASLWGFAWRTLREGGAGRGMAIARRALSVAAGLLAGAGLLLFAFGGERLEFQVARGRSGTAADPGAGAAPGGAVPPPVVLIVIDTLRADHVGAYEQVFAGSRDRGPDVLPPGRESLTPVLDALAAEGVLFANAVTNAPWTRPAMASLWTGRLPAAHGLVHGRGVDTAARVDRLDETAETLAERLSGAGWPTVGINANRSNSARFGLDQGFDVYHTFSRPVFERTALCHLVEALLAASYTPEAYVNARGVVDAALGWVRGAPRGPFLLYVHFMDPHAPMWDEPDNLWSRRPNPCATGDIPRARRTYARSVAFTDRHIGRLFEELKRAGLYDDSLVIVTSDHGEEFLEHGHCAHGQHLVSEQIAVPLIVKPPRSFDAPAPGTVVETPVSLVDVAPTVLAAARQSVPAGLAGDDLFALKPKDRAVYSEIGSHAEWQRAVTTPGWRFVHRSGLRDDTSHVPDHALYDLSEDRCSHSTAGDDATRIARTLERRIESTYERLERLAVMPEEVEVTPDLLDSLRSLGYVDVGSGAASNP